MSPKLENKSSTNAPARLPAWMQRDWIVAAALFVFAAGVGGWYVPHFVRGGGKPLFYQDQFGPAVMLACGAGYVNPATDTLPSVEEFLRIERDSIECDSRFRQAATQPLTSRQRAFRYLIMTTGMVWRLQSHPSWSGLAPLYGALYGATVMLAYFLFRQGMGRVLATLFAIAISVSTLHLNNLAGLRDYAKAPFVLGLVLLAMRLVVAPASRRRVLRLAAVAGAVTGVGVGFRSDLLVAVPAFIVLLACLLPLRLREGIALKATAIATYLIVFGLALSPMWSIYRTGGGNSSQHLILLGLSQPFSDALGLDNGDLYDWSYDYRDEFAHAMVSSYGAQHMGVQDAYDIYGPDYDRAAASYLRDIALNFPADMLVRVYASGLKLAGLPHNATALGTPGSIDEPRILRVYAMRAAVLRYLGQIWPFAFIMTIAGLSIWSVRLGFFALLLLLYLSGYPALQFHERHFFQLEFIGWWVLGFTLSLGGAALMAATDPRRRARWIDTIRPQRGWRRGAAAAMLLWLCAAVLILGPLWVLRQYQQRHVEGLLKAYLDAPREKLPLSYAPLGNGWVGFDGPAQSESARRALEGNAVHADYIVSEFGGSRCGTVKLDVIYRYTFTEPQFDFSRTVRVPLPASNATTRVFFPAYFHRPLPQGRPRAGYGLAAVELPEAYADCLVEMARVRDPEQLPVPLGLRLPPGWDGASLYETVAAVERRSSVAGTPNVYTSPVDMPVARGVTDEALQQFAAGDVVLKADGFTMNGHQWRVSGSGGAFAYLVEMKPRFVKKGAVVLAEGRLETGGVTFGLVRGSTWAAQVTVTRPGDFLAVVRAPSDGEYAVVLANNLQNTLLPNDLVVTRAGFVHE